MDEQRDYGVFLDLEVKWGLLKKQLQIVLADSKQLTILTRYMLQFCEPRESQPTF